MSHATIQSFSLKKKYTDSGKKKVVFNFLSERNTAHDMDPVHQYPPVKSIKKRWQTVFLALIGELLDWPTAAYGCGLL